MVEAPQNAPESTPVPSPPFWLGPVRFVFQILRIVVVVATVLGTKAAMNEGGPLAGLAIVAGLLLLILLSWLLSKGLHLLVVDAARQQPSRALAAFKLILGLPLVYLALVGLNPEWAFGLLPAGFKGPLYALAFAVPLALGIHLVLMGSVAFAGSRPPSWIRALVALVVIGGGVALGPAMSQAYLAHERAVGKYPLYTSDFGSYQYFAFTPQNDGLFLADHDGKVTRWNFSGGEPEVLKGPNIGSGFWSVAFDRGARFLAWRRSSSHGVLDLAAKKDVVTQDGLADCVALSDDGKTFARAKSGIGDPELELLAVADGSSRRKLPVAGSKKLVALAFHPDGNQLYSASEERVILLWDTAAGKSRELARLSGSIYRLATSPDGKLLAAGGNEIGVTVLDADSGATVTRFDGHGDGLIATITFSPDSQTIVSSAGVSRGNVIAWDARTGRALYRRDLDGVIFSSALSPSNQRIATSGDYYVKVWDVSGVLPAGGN